MWKAGDSIDTELLFKSVFMRKVSIISVYLVFWRIPCP